MASLSDLTNGLAEVTGLPKATVFAYGRFAREAGQIAQIGRGRAAKMTSRDAANLLLAIGGTDITRDAGQFIREVREFKGRILWQECECLSGESNVSKALNISDEMTLGSWLEQFLMFIGENRLSSALLKVGALPIQKFEADRLKELRKKSNLSASEVREEKELAMLQTGVGGSARYEMIFMRNSRAIEMGIIRSRLGRSEKIASVRFEPEQYPEKSGISTVRYIEHAVICKAAEIVFEQVQGKT